MRPRCPAAGLALLLLVLQCGISGIEGFLPSSKNNVNSWTLQKKVSAAGAAAPGATTSTSLLVSIGLGPDEKEVKEKELAPGVDYEIPNHEEYRLSRRSKFDEKCDEWFGKLLGAENGVLGSLAVDARQILNQPVPLENEVSYVVRQNLATSRTYCTFWSADSSRTVDSKCRSFLRLLPLLITRKNGPPMLPPDFLGLQ